jgi:hypothetical protein
MTGSFLVDMIGSQVTQTQAGSLAAKALGKCSAARQEQAQDWQTWRPQW